MSIFSRGEKPSRAEKQVRHLSRGLWVVSRGLLIVCMAMTAIFGWGMGTWWLSAGAFAIGYALCDIAGAYCWETSGVGSARKIPVLAVGAGFLGFLCFAFSLTGIIGFSSTNREAVAQSRKDAKSLSTDTVNWAKSVVVDKATGKDKKDVLFDGIKEVSGLVNDQIKKLNSGELVTVTDGQALVLSKIFKTDEETARSYATAGGATVLLIIQYGCIWMYGFIRQRVEPEITEAKDQPSSDGPEDVKPKRKPHSPRLPPNTTKAAAKVELLRWLADGVAIPSQKWLAKKWGISEATVVAWLNDWGIERKRMSVGQGNVILPPLTNGHAKGTA